MIRGRLQMAPGLVTFLLVVAGCSAAPASTTPTQASESPRSSTSPVAAASRAPVSATSPASAKAAGLSLIPIAGYTYTTPPAAMRQMAGGLEATGVVSSVVGRGVKDRSGTLVAAIMVLQYNPKLTALAKKRSASQVLAGAVQGARATSQGKVDVTSLVLSGNQVRLLRTASTSVAIFYVPGGKLFQVIGPAPAPVRRVTEAYLAALTAQ